MNWFAVYVLINPAWRCAPVKPIALVAESARGLARIVHAWKSALAIRISKQFRLNAQVVHVVMLLNVDFERVSPLVSCFFFFFLFVFVFHRDFVLRHAQVCHGVSIELSRRCVLSWQRRNLPIERCIGWHCVSTSQRPLRRTGGLLGRLVPTRRIFVVGNCLSSVNGPYLRCRRTMHWYKCLLPFGCFA